MSEISRSDILVFIVGTIFVIGAIYVAGPLAGFLVFALLVLLLILK